MRELFLFCNIVITAQRNVEMGTLLAIYPVKIDVNIIKIKSIIFNRVRVATDSTRIEVLLVL